MGKEEQFNTIVDNMAPVDLGLYYTDGDQTTFWETVVRNPAYKEEIEEIRQEGERLLAEPIPLLTYRLFTMFARQGTRLEYERVYFERRRRLNTFALLTLVEPGKAEYLSVLCDMLWSICDEYTWCLPAHLNTETSANVRSTIDLFSAETGFTLSEIRLLFGEQLPRLLISRMEEEVSKRLFDPFLGDTHGWETATHNWSAVCAGSIGSAALLLMTQPDSLKRILLKTQRSMGYYLQGFGADGACLEGLGYWNYGFGYFVYYADLLRKRSQGAMDWFRDVKVSRIASFQQKCFLGGKAVVNFSDAQPEGSVHIGLSHYLAGLYEDFESPPVSLRAAYRDDHCSRWAPALRNLLWRDPGSQGSDWGEIDHYLPDAQWLISRRADADGHEVYAFAAKGGRNDEPHNHNDIGHFILYGAGEVWCSDLGCGEYTADYFGDGRYGYDCNGSQGHSVPVIDGYLQEAGSESGAVVLEAVAGGDVSRLKLDLTSAYRSPVLKKFTRAFVWNKEGHRPVLSLRDQFQFSASPNSLMERIVTRMQPELKRVDDRWVVVLNTQAAGEQRRIQRQEYAQAQQPGHEDQERIQKQKPNQGQERTQGQKQAYPMAGRPQLAIHYDGELLEPELKRHTFRDHSGNEAVWYAVDFSVKKTDISVTVDFKFEFISTGGVERHEDGNGFGLVDGSVG